MELENVEKLKQHFTVVPAEYPNILPLFDMADLVRSYPVST